MTERIPGDVEAFFNEIHQENQVRDTVIYGSAESIQQFSNAIDEEELEEEGLPMRNDIVSPIPININTDNLTVQESPILTIPENSSTGFIKENNARFSGALWYDKIQTKSVILAGIGGIGSYVAFLLSRMNVGFITLYDPDIVEAVNMSGQLYGNNSIDKFKVNAISNFIEEYSRYYTIAAINEKYTYESSAEDIMICGFDSMAARKVYFENWKDHVNNSPENYRQNCLYIDGRLSAETLQVFCIRGDDKYNMELYEDLHLFDSSEADPTVCSYKQTTFMANMIGSIIVNLFTNFVANQCEPLIDRELPFFTEYSAETMYLNVIK